MKAILSFSAMTCTAMLMLVCTGLITSLYGSTGSCGNTEPDSVACPNPAIFKICLTNNPCEGSKEQDKINDNWECRTSKIETTKYCRTGDYPANFALCYEEYNCFKLSDGSCDEDVSTGVDNYAILKILDDCAN